LNQPIRAAIDRFYAPPSGIMSATQRRFLLLCAILAAFAVWCWNLVPGSGWSSSFTTVAGQRERGLRNSYQLTKGH